MILRNRSSHDCTILEYLAWAHLILYGEEATRQAQKEGEEAAAAYEREQKDIAAGKLPEPSPKKKPKKPAAKKEPPAADKAEPAESASKPESAAPKKRKSIRDATGAAPEKKAKTNTKACKLEKEAIGSTVAKGVTRVCQLEAIRYHVFQGKLLTHSLPVGVRYRPKGDFRRLHRRRPAPYGRDQNPSSEGLPVLRFGSAIQPASR
jgi:hypothetical protein